MDNGALGSLSVSRETSQRLSSFAHEIARWTKSINLISSSTTEDVWNRHILDCAQTVIYAPQRANLWCDLGAGAGLPGLVAAIIDREQHPERRFVLMESDKRKAAFLTIQIKEFDLNAVVSQHRIEQADPVLADVISARALAPLPKLLTFSLRHGKQDSTLIFLKGRGYPDEISQARQEFSFDVVAGKSISDPDGAVLVITSLSRSVQS